MERESGRRPIPAPLLLIVAAVALLVLVFVVALGGRDEGPDFGADRPAEKEGESDEQEARDWVTLLLVPLTLAVVGYVYTSYETRRTEAVEDRRSQEERLGTFLDEMDKMIVDRHLRTSTEPDLRLMARARVLTVLLNMDRERKRRPLKAVYELDLVARGGVVVSLAQADLDDAELTEAVLPGIDLQGVYARRADFSKADLRNADLKNSYLGGARFNDANSSGADLSGADLSGADFTNATMP